MHAVVGDMLVVRGHRAGEPDRAGQIIHVHAADGGPPYTVRWDDDGHVGLVFPGPDATIRTPGPARAPTGGRRPPSRRTRSGSGRTPAKATALRS
jgi:hypothetical protein